MPTIKKKTMESNDDYSDSDIEPSQYTYPPSSPSNTYVPDHIPMMGDLETLERNYSAPYCDLPHDVWDVIEIILDEFNWVQSTPFSGDYHRDHFYELIGQLAHLCRRGIPPGGRP